MRRLALAALLTLACGYSTRSLLPANLRTIAIPPVVNQTVRPFLGELLTQQLATDFTRDGRLRVVGGQSDLLLECQVTNFTKGIPVYDASQRVYLYRVTIDARVVCQDQVRMSPLWEGSVQGWANYDPSSQSEDDAVALALKDLSQKTIDKILTAW